MNSRTYNIKKVIMIVIMAGVLLVGGYFAWHWYQHRRLTAQVKQQLNRLSKSSDVIPEMSIQSQQDLYKVSNDINKVQTQINNL